MHLENAFVELEREYASCELVKSDIFTIYKETVTMKSGTTVMVKSQNKHNRLYGYGEPISR